MEKRQEARMRPNIIFIIIDAVRARNVGAYGYDKPTTPNIDKIAQEGLLFRDAYSCINYTDSSMTSIFSGIYPVSHGIMHMGASLKDEELKTFSQSGIELLPEILRSEGYSTIALDWMGRWHRRGYNYYSGITNVKLLEPINHIMRTLSSHKSLQSLKAGMVLLRRRILSKSYSAEFTTDRAINLVEENRNKPFFLFIHYWDVHQGYSVPKRYSRLFRSMNYSEIPSHTEKVGGLYSFSDKGLRSLGVKLLSGSKTVSEQVSEYDGAIRYVDNEIGRLVEALKKHGIADQTLLIITSDHGESLTEHGIYFDHHGLYEVSIHVPLIMRYPEGLPDGKAIEGFVQHVDLVPTILDLLEIKASKEVFDGESLMPSIRMGEELRSSVYIEEAYAERKRGVRTRNYEYIEALSEEEAICRLCNRIHGGVEELYDLENDPEQNDNLVEDMPETAKAMQNLLAEWVAYLEGKKARRTKANLKDKISMLKHSGKL